MDKNSAITENNFISPIPIPPFIILIHMRDTKRIARAAANSEKTIPITAFFSINISGNTKTAL